MCEYEHPSGYTSPPNVKKNTALLESSVSVSLMGLNTACKRAKIQEPNKTLVTPSKASIVTMKTLELLMKKLPKEARKSFQVPYLPHNLIAAN